MNEPYILFEVNQTSYAVPSAQVQQVEMLDKITRVPNAPDFVDGIVHLRGRVVPVINLRGRFGFERIDYDLRARLIVVQLGERTVGMAVDSAREFASFDSDAILEPPESLINARAEYLEGIFSLDDRLILVLDLQRVLTPEEQAAVEKLT